MCFILFLLLAQSLSAKTTVTGTLAQSLYHLIPNKPVRHSSPRLMDIKLLPGGIYCAKRINEPGFDYKCLLPNMNSNGTIDIMSEAAQILFDALSSSQESKENLSEIIICTAHTDSNSTVYHCIITP